MDFPPEMGDYFNEIGVQAVRLVGNPDAKILIYGEVVNGLEHMIFRYANPGDVNFRCRDDTDLVGDAMRDAWEYSRSLGYEWTGILYRLADRKMTVNLLYGGDIDPEDSMYDKEEKILEKYYPGMEVEPFSC